MGFGVTSSSEETLERSSGSFSRRHHTSLWSQQSSLSGSDQTWWSDQSRIHFNLCIWQWLSCFVVCYPWHCCWWRWRALQIWASQGDLSGHVLPPQIRSDHSTNESRRNQMCDWRVNREWILNWVDLSNWCVWNFQMDKTSQRVGSRLRLGTDLWK